MLYFVYGTQFTYFSVEKLSMSKVFASHFRYNEQHPCLECTSVFRMRTDLKSHILNVHRAKENCRHYCESCGKLLLSGTLGRII